MYLHRPGSPAIATREEITAAVEALEARHGPFAVHDAVLRALSASGWDPAGDGEPTRHDPGIADIILANVDTERDLALCLQQVELQARGRPAGPLDAYRPLARRILARVLAEAAPAS